jgi:hypothetical protein
MKRSPPPVAPPQVRGEATARSTSAPVPVADSTSSACCTWSLKIIPRPMKTCGPSRRSEQFVQREDGRGHAQSTGHGGRHRRDARGRNLATTQGNRAPAPMNASLWLTQESGEMEIWQSVFRMRVSVTPSCQEPGPSPRVLPRTASRNTVASEAGLADCREPATSTSGAAGTGTPAWLRGWREDEARAVLGDQCEEVSGTLARPRLSPASGRTEARPPRVASSVCRPWLNPLPPRGAVAWSVSVSLGDAS